MAIVHSWGSGSPRRHTLPRKSALSPCWSTRNFIVYQTSGSHAKGTDFSRRSSEAQPRIWIFWWLPIRSMWYPLLMSPRSGRVRPLTAPRRSAWMV